MTEKTTKPEEGQSLVELALMLPLLLLILLGLLDFGRVYYVMVSLYDAAEEGAIYASAWPGDEPGIKERAAHASTALVTVREDEVYPTFAVNPPQAGTTVTVTVLYDFEFYTPVANMFFTDNSVTLRGQAVKAVIGAP